MEKRAVVVGAGISGLTAAYRLQQRGVEVTVLERSAHGGGKMAAVRRDGFILNVGATILSGSYTTLLGLAEELGVSDGIAPLAPTIGFYGEREAEIHLIRRTDPRSTVEDLISTPLLSAPSKVLLARIALDLAAARDKLDYRRPQAHAELDTETVSDYCARRLNDELLERVVSPLITGLYLDDGRGVSAAGMYVSLAKLSGGLVTYRGGGDFIVQALATRLDLRTNAEVLLVEQEADGARVVWSHDGQTHDERVDGVVLAVDSPTVLKIHPGLPGHIRGILAGFEYCNVISVRLAVTPRPPSEAAVVVVPYGAVGGIGLVIYEHAVSLDAAPSGSGVIGVMLHHEWATARMNRTDDELLTEIVDDLEALLPGIRHDIVFAEINRWQPVAPSGRLGTQQRVAELNDAIDPDAHVQLAGDFLTIPGLEGSTVAGEAAAGRLAAVLNVPPVPAEPVHAEATMSENDFNTQVIEEFRAARGSAVSIGKMPLVLLHHIGVRSGLPRISPLAYVHDAGRYVLLASGGGRDANPAWYGNLMASGRATIEVGAETLEVEAQDAVGEERDRLFSVLVERIPEFADYLDKTDRAMPVVLLTPIERVNPEEKI